MEKLLEEFSIGLFFWQTLIFISLIFLLKKFAWKPILEAINEREDGIKNHREYGMIGKQLGLGLLEKDKSIILDLINTIKNKEVK